MVFCHSNNLPLYPHVSTSCLKLIGRPMGQPCLKYLGKGLHLKVSVGPVLVVMKNFEIKISSSGLWVSWLVSPSLHIVQVNFFRKLFILIPISSSGLVKSNDAFLFKKAWFLPIISEVASTILINISREHLF